VTTCVRCGHELGIGRFCLNCGHPVDAPLPAEETPLTTLHEESSPDRPDLGSPSWVPWAVGVSLLLMVLGVLAVLASILGGDDDPAAGMATEPQPTSTESQAPPAEVVDLTRTVKVKAPPAAPPTADLDGQLVSYGARRMLDGEPETAWRTTGDATGQTITFSLREATSIRRVGLINGYARKVPSGATLVDWYPHNRRITLVEWVFDDGTSVQQKLREKSKLQRLTIELVTTTTVQLRVLAVTPPGAGVLGRDYTAISEILIAGAPAA
jgi:hypothetical protein